MFGFLKKSKKSEEEQPSPDQEDQAAQDADSTQTQTEVPAKKKFPIKKILLILLVLILLGGGGFAAYTFFMAPKDSSGKKAEYKKIQLDHIQLDDEILAFSFKHFYDLYQALVSYNTEITLIDQEISRIDAIGQQYPDQKKIADKEIKTWKKTKTGLEKSFLKIQKPVKETYVLFRVNKEQGLVRIQEVHADLTQTANEALITAQALTDKLKSKEDIPEGLFKGTLYKLKKKFL